MYALHCVSLPPPPRKNYPDNMKTFFFKIKKSKPTSVQRNSVVSQAISTTSAHRDLGTAEPRPSCPHCHNGKQCERLVDYLALYNCTVNNQSEWSGLTPVLH